MLQLTQKEFEVRFGEHTEKTTIIFTTYVYPPNELGYVHLNEATKNFLIALGCKEIAVGEDIDLEITDLEATENWPIFVQSSEPNLLQ